MARLEDLAVWVYEKFECVICSHTWVAVFCHWGEKLECPGCGYMNSRPDSE